MLLEGNFKTVGRFTLAGFDPKGEEPVVIIDFNGRDGAAHKRMDLVATKEAFTPGALGILIDSLPPGEERDYLDAIHTAMEELVSATFGLSHLFDKVNRNLADAETDGTVEAHVQRAQALLRPIYQTSVPK